MSEHKPEFLVPAAMVGDSVRKSLKAATTFLAFWQGLHIGMGRMLMYGSGQERTLPDLPPDIPSAVKPVIRNVAFKLAMMLHDAISEGICAAGESATFVEQRDAILRSFDRLLDSYIMATTPPPELQALMLQEHIKTCPGCKAADEEAKADAGKTAQQELDAAASRTKH